MAIVDLTVEYTVLRLSEEDVLASFFSTVSYRLEPDGWGTRFPALMDDLYLGHLPAERVAEAASELATVREELARLPAAEAIADYDDPERPAFPPPESSDAVAAEYFRSHDDRELLTVLDRGLEVAREHDAPLEIEVSELPAEVGGPEPPPGLDREAVVEILGEEARGVLESTAREGDRALEWRDDRGWCMGMVDLQESTSQPGAFLNAGVDWMWYERDWLAYAVGGRAGDFVPAQDEESFRSAARALAARAAELLEDYRRRFRDIEACASYLHEHGTDTEWSPLDAGIACGLAGRMEDARGWLERFAAEAEPGTAPGDEADRARRLAAATSDQQAFRVQVCATIAAQRQRLGLAPVEIELCR